MTAVMNTAGLRAKMAALVNAGPASRRAVVAEMGRAIVSNMIVNAPRDTRRYVRAWAEAGNAAGVGTFALPSLQRAKRTEQILAALKGQADYWGFIVARYERAGRRDIWYTKALRKLQYAREQLEKFIEQERRGGAIIAINAFSAADYKKPVRIVNPPYGGTGQIIDRNGATFIRLHNREAHATFVERHAHVVRNASQAYKAAGLKQVKGKYLEKALVAINQVRGVSISGGA